MAAMPAKKGNRFPRGSCWNCGEKGHFKPSCPKPLRTKPVQNDGKSVPGKTHTNSPAGSANAAIAAIDDEGDGAWAVLELSDIEDDLPGLLSESDVESDEEGNSLTSSYFPAMDDTFASFAQACSVDPEGCDVEGLAAGVMPKASGLSRIALLDSGTTCHISPYRSEFLNYRELPARVFQAANKQSFSAVGSGDLVLEVPNGAKTSKLTLNDVLYSPAISYILISIGKLDTLGHRVEFRDGRCTIFFLPANSVVGTIPKSARGLYHIQKSPHVPADDAEHAAMAQLTVMELHHRMGHIAPGAAKKLVTEGLVSGVELRPDGEELTFCASCIFAKASRKPVPKGRDPAHRATAFGEEVHSDIWGPARIQTLGHRHYYVTFTDDFSRLTHLHLLRRKAETFAAYREFEAWCHTQMRVPIWTL